jgi:hypothetical protein
MHLGIYDGAFMPHYKLWGPCRFARVPDGPQTYFLNICILWLQQEAAQIRMSE